MRVKSGITPDLKAKDIPQRLKPGLFCSSKGTAEAVPLQSKVTHRLRAVARVVVCLLSAASFAQGPAKSAATGGSLKAVVGAARARVEQSDVRASGRLVAIAANGARTNNTLTLASHSFPDGLRTMITVSSPGHGSVRYLLVQDEAGHTAIEVMGRDGKTPLKLTPERWGEGIAGTVFSPEDFADGQFFWAKQAVLPPAKYGARDCFVLKSEPGAGQLTQYASVTTWIDQKNGARVYVEAVPRGGQPEKQFVFYDIEQTGGVWVSRQVEAKQKGKPGSSLLIIEHGSPHAHLQRKDFSLGAPVAPAGSETAP